MHTYVALAMGNHDSSHKKNGNSDSHAYHTYKYNL